VPTSRSIDGGAGGHQGKNNKLLRREGVEREKGKEARGEVENGLVMTVTRGRSREGQLVSKGSKGNKGPHST